MFDAWKLAVMESMGAPQASLVIINVYIYCQKQCICTCLCICVYRNVAILYEIQQKSKVRILI